MVLLLYKAIIVKFIKSMPQRRQEQTAEREGGRKSRGEEEEREINIETVDHKTGRQEAGGWREKCITFSTIYNTRNSKVKD